MFTEWKICKYSLILVTILSLSFLSVSSWLYDEKYYIMIEEFQNEENVITPVIFVFLLQIAILNYMILLILEHNKISYFVFSCLGNAKTVNQQNLHYDKK